MLMCSTLQGLYTKVLDLVNYVDLNYREDDDVLKFVSLQLDSLLADFSPFI